MKGFRSVIDSEDLGKVVAAILVSLSPFVVAFVLYVLLALIVSYIK
jgi:hypothetical protein